MLGDDPSTPDVVRRRCRPGGLGLLGQRLEVCPHESPRQRLLNRMLDLARDSVGFLEGRVARQLQVERDLRAAVDLQHADVVDLAHAPHLHRGGVGELARDRVLLGRLDVDDDVRLGKCALYRRLDGIGPA